MLAHFAQTARVRVNLVLVTFNFNQLLVDFKAIVINLHCEIINLILDAFTLSTHFYLDLEQFLIKLVKLCFAADLLLKHCHLKKIYPLDNLRIILAKMQYVLLLRYTFVQYRIYQVLNQAANLCFKGHPIKILIK